jgi:hypothetical protein
VLVASPNASACLKLCQMAQNASAVTAARDAVALLADCQSRCNGNGYELQSNARVTMVDCVSDGDTTACRVAAGSRLTALNLRVTDCGDACCVLSAGVAKFSDSLFTRCGQVGFVGNAKSELLLHGCTISEVHRMCVALSEGSSGHLTYCALSRALSGLKVSDPGSVLQATKCAISSIKERAAAANLSGELSLCSCTLRENGEGVHGAGLGTLAKLEDCTLESHTDSGVIAADGAHVQVLSSRSRGNAVGFRAQGQAPCGHMSQVHVTDSSSANDVSDVYVSGRGVIVMKDVTADGVTRSGSLAAK